MLSIRYSLFSRPWRPGFGLTMGYTNEGIRFHKRKNPRPRARQSGGRLGGYPCAPGRTGLGGKTNRVSVGTGIPAMVWN